MKPTTIYKNAKSKSIIMDLYDKKLNFCEVEYKSIYTNTFAGKTHVLQVGNSEKPPLVVLQGIHAGSGTTLSAIKKLTSCYQLYIIDTIGQATKSSETTLPLKGNHLANWLNEVLDELELKNVSILGISYGAFLLQKLITYYPEKINKVIFLVPSGLTNGSLSQSFKKITVPLIKFMFFKKNKHLKQMMNAFYTEYDKDDVLFQKTILTGVKMDFRRPHILTAKQTKLFDKPVYIIAAENDIFFPANEAIKKCEELFPNFKESFILKSSKHIPGNKSFLDIEEKVKEWLS